MDYTTILLKLDNERTDLYINQAEYHNLINKKDTLNKLLFITFLSVLLGFGPGQAFLISKLNMLSTTTPYFVILPGVALSLISSTIVAFSVIGKSKLKKEIKKAFISFMENKENIKILEEQLENVIKNNQDNSIEEPIETLSLETMKEARRYFKNQMKQAENQTTSSKTKTLI